MQTVPVNCYCFAVGVTGQSYSGKPAHPVRKNSHFFYWRLRQGVAVGHWAL